MVKQFGILLFILLFSTPLAALTQLTARIDKNPVMLGESLQLELTADARLGADAVSFRQLENHFTVMVPAVSQSTRVINGAASHTTSWQVTLLPKNTGNFTIPAFSINGISSAPISIEVINTSQSNATQTPTLFLQSQLEQDQLYVQQLSYYQVTIYFSGELQRGSLSEPQLEGAVIQQIGQDQEGSELVNGVRYRTISRRYTITPQRSGSFEITPPTFSGEMLERDGGRYTPFARTRTVVQQAQPISVTVSPIPDDFPGDWLIAGLVTLTEEWHPDSPNLKQGDPVTRIITLSAVDVAENQLPELKQGLPEGLRLYQEQPQNKSAERSGRLVAQKIVTTAIIASRDGELILPEIKLPWWNSQTNQLAFATLPAKTLQVSPAITATSELPALPPPVSVTPPVVSISQSPWAWTYSTSLVTTLWFLTLFFAAYLWYRQTSASTTLIPENSKVRFDQSKLKQACQQGDALTAKAELLRWGHQQLGQKYQSLSALSAQLQHSELVTEIAALNKTLYQATPAPWQGKTLYQHWLQYHNQKVVNNSASKLPSLYS